MLIIISTMEKIVVFGFIPQAYDPHKVSVVEVYGGSL